MPGTPDPQGENSGDGKQGNGRSRYEREIEEILRNMERPDGSIKPVVHRPLAMPMFIAFILYIGVFLFQLILWPGEDLLKRTLIAGISCMVVFLLIRLIRRPKKTG